MAYAAPQTAFKDKIERFRPAAAARPPSRRSLLRRLYDSIMEGRQRRVQRDIDRFVAWHGSKFTDDIEREIGSRLLTGNWNTRR